MRVDFAAYMSSMLTTLSMALPFCKIVHVNFIQLRFLSIFMNALHCDWNFLSLLLARRLLLLEPLLMYFSMIFLQSSYGRFGVIV